jgi:ABC-2 type transport system permease protein
VASRDRVLLGAATLLRKETIEVVRDSTTLRIIVAIPIIQLFLLGYAINSDLKHLPTSLLSVGESKYMRTIAASMRNSGYFDIRMLHSEAEAEIGIARGASC